MSENIITGLDIGSRAIRIAVGQLIDTGDGSGERVHIIGAVDVPAEGIHKGTITSLEDAVSSVSKAIEFAERMVGVPITSAWVGMSGSQVLVQGGKGVIGVGRTDGEIQDEDVERVIDAAKSLAHPANYEILHVIPKTFAVDGQYGIKDPVGMSGIRLEVDTVTIQALATQMKHLTKCVYRTGLDIEDVVYAPLATSEALLTERQKQLGVCLVNIGASTTSVIVFEEGDVLHTAILPIGSNHVTNDVAIGLRTSVEAAEQIKIEYGHALPSAISKEHNIFFKELGFDVDKDADQIYVSEIIQARVEEIFERVDDQLAQIDRSGMLPGGIVLTGGGSKLSGLIDIGKHVLRLPVSQGELIDITSVIETAANPGFSTAVGLVKWGSEIHEKGGGPLAVSQIFNRFKSTDKAVQQIRKWLRSLIP